MRSAQCISRLGAVKERTFCHTAWLTLLLFWFVLIRSCSVKMFKSPHCLWLTFKCSLPQKSIVFPNLICHCCFFFLLFYLATVEFRSSVDSGVCAQEHSVKSSLVLATKKSVTYPGDHQETSAKPPLYHKQPPALPPKPFPRIPNHSTGPCFLYALQLQTTSDWHDYCRAPLKDEGASWSCSGRDKKNKY